MNCKIHFSYCYTQNAFHVLSTVQGKGSFNTHCVCSQKGLILDILPIACVCVCVCLRSASPRCVSISIRRGWWVSAFPPLLTCCGDHAYVLIQFESTLEVVQPYTLVGLVKCAVTTEEDEPLSLAKRSFQITWIIRSSTCESMSSTKPDLILTWEPQPNLKAW